MCIWEGLAMFKRTLGLWSVAIALSTVYPTAVCSRQIEDWPYDKLFKQAELVVVAKVTSVEDAGKRVTDKPPAEYLLGVITAFEVQYAIKGDLTGKKLTVFHYRLHPKQAG